ncbi:putative glucan 1,3-beta-glucosidase D [Cytospora mali]|uniref:glucan 1,3-beta-glucosidase n=1 Tax=Cytospora mali TaxID=578113 RepID=A0A194UMV8_CYTMA|nr:putative glucan 1,3-beta-glucosidase D [Valsa mali var. pyri (nom. inval.)]
MADRQSRPRGSGERRHKSGRSGSRHHASPSDGTRTGHSSRQTLSLDALAALNEANTRGVSSRDAEEELERRRRQERRERRKREQRARADRDEYQEVDTENPRAHRQRESRSYQPPPPPAYDEVDTGSDYHNERRERRRQRSSKAYEAPRETYPDEVRDDDRERRRERKRKPRIAAGGAAAEEAYSHPKSLGQQLRGGGTNASTSYDSFDSKEEVYDEEPQKRGFWTKKKILIGAGVSIAILIIIIVAAVVVSKKSSKSSGSDSKSGSSSSCLKCNLPSQDSIPSGAPDYLNPFDWYDTIDFNVTYTDEMVGNLPIMGLNSTWDNSAAANSLVPALNEDWGSYADRPARGVNLGGWLSIEPWITPDLFDYDEDLGIVDEWTLCTYLGSSCASTLEKHYSSFVTESTFAEIADAGLDHVRIPYSYWAVEVYDDEPYLFRTSWRYLLRGIEWARKYGLRINLDLHGIPGSQNGWNHSGRLGPIGWFNGTNSTQNVQRSIDVHDRLSKFFAQERYSSIISHYGLANEPRMTVISANEVINWTETVYSMVRANGLNNSIVVFGDGFRGLANWHGEMTGYGDTMALDVHQYVIFNNEQIVYNHSQKVNYACEGWTQQSEMSMNTSTGFGPTLVAEWSQADTDCATYLNNVGWGNRWTGTYNTYNASDPLAALTPRCPLEDDTCSCASANADPSEYTDDYKQFLLYFAEAQMDSFEAGWGWFYWTWWTSEGSWQWSYKRGLEAGILPAKAYDRSFHCNSSSIPDWSPELPEYY